MITKVLKCDVKGCDERQETVEGEKPFLTPGWLVRTVTDRWQLPEGHIVGGEMVYHYCPSHCKALTDLYPRVKQEITARETLAQHNNTHD